MGLGVYDAPFGNRFSEDGLQNYPITTTHKGNDGETVELLLYLRNDDPYQYYSDIAITVIDIASPDDTQGDQGTGWGVKLVAGAEQPTRSKWASVRYANTIQMEDIGSLGNADTTTFYPFWYKIESPPGEDVKTKIDIKIQIDATKNAV
jgi:hypothetical protein